MDTSADENPDREGHAVKAVFLPSTKVDRGLLAAFVGVSAVLVVALAVLMSACSGTEAATTSVSGTITTQTVTTTAASSATTLVGDHHAVRNHYL